MLVLAWVFGFALLWLPGALVVRLLRISVPDPLVRVALQCTIGFSLLPIALLWSSTLQLTLEPMVVRVALAALIAGGLASILIVPRRSWHSRRRYIRHGAGFLAVALIVAGLVVQTRVAHVRGLALPPWVDPIHHTMTTSLILEEGSVPETLGRYIPGAPFAYHFGFHANLAALCTILGTTDAESVAVLMLHFGQLLNALVLLTVYACAKQLLNSRSAALLAAALAMLVSWFPAYYLSWGRYPHLGGVLLLTVVVAFLRVARRQTACNLALLTILATGLFLTHVRVAFFAAILACLFAVVLAAKRRWRALLSLLLCSSLTIILIVPFGLRLAHARELVASISGERVLTEEDAQRTVPADHLWAPNNNLLFGVATGGISEILLHRTVAAMAAGVAWWLTLIGLAERDRRNRAEQKSPWGVLLLLAAWCAMTAALLVVPPDIFPLSRAVSWSSAIITLFVPASIAAGGLLSWSLRVVTRRWGLVASAILTLLVAMAGAYRMQQLVNPGTILADEDDLHALRWMNQQLGPDFNVASEYRPWLGSAWVASEGAIWIPVLTRCRTPIPPALYAWTRDEAAVSRFTSTAATFAQLSSLGPADVVEACEAAGATHVYVSRDLPALGAKVDAASPRIRRVHSSGDVTIYEIVPAD